MKLDEGRKVALVTGAGSGIGKATATALAAEGYAVGLLGNDLEDVIPFAGELKALGFTATALKADISVESECELPSCISSRDSEGWTLLSPMPGSMACGLRSTTSNQTSGTVRLMSISGGVSHDPHDGSPSQDRRRWRDRHRVLDQWHAYLHGAGRDRVYGDQGWAGGHGSAARRGTGPPRDTDQRGLPGRDRHQYR
jgi:hypothetical protein